jgi:uncharacterized membrane protein YgdD (TMEM256/DUF423 family)
LFNLVTPLGGVLFILGWLWLLFSIPGKTADKQAENRSEN